MGEIPKQILEGIETELRYAKEKFPLWPDDPIHAAAIVAEEAGEVVKAALQFTYEDGNLIHLYNESKQTATMCIRLMKNLDNYIKRNTFQHED